MQGNNLRKPTLRRAKTEVDEDPPNINDATAGYSTHAAPSLFVTVVRHGFCLLDFFGSLFFFWLSLLPAPFFPSLDLGARSSWSESTKPKPIPKPHVCSHSSKRSVDWQQYGLFLRLRAKTVVVQGGTCN